MEGGLEAGGDAGFEDGGRSPELRDVGGSWQLEVASPLGPPGEGAALLLL